MSDAGIDLSALELRWLAEINKVVNEVGTTWKTKRAILRHQLGVEEPLLSELVPMGGYASDY